MKIKKNIIVVVLTFLFSLSSLLEQNSCNTTNPVDNIQPGRRDYEWTIDTLKVPEGYNTSVSRMWGSSAADVWAVGSALSVKHEIWHYDGKIWNYIPQNLPIDPFSIWGSASDNIWLGSTDSYIWHYDGASWNRFVKLSYEGYDFVIVQWMRGTDANNIYGVGLLANQNNDNYAGIIVRYNGKIWEIINNPETDISFEQIEFSNNVMLIVGENLKKGGYILYKYANEKLQKIIENNSVITINHAGNSAIIVMNKKLYKYNIFNINLTLFQDFSNTNYVGRLWGRNEKDFFTQNEDGIGHYNGTDLLTIYSVPSDFVLFIAEVFSDDIFFIYEDFSTESVMAYHGKLKGGNE